MSWGSRSIFPLHIIHRQMDKLMLLIKPSNIRRIKGLMPRKEPRLTNASGLMGHQKTSQIATSQTSFSMTYRMEAMSPIEVGLPSPQWLHFNEVSNKELRRCELDFFEERMNRLQSKLAMYQRKMTRYYSSKVKKKALCVNGLVFRRVFFSTKEPQVETFGSNREGPYSVREEVRLRSYQIEGLDGKV